MMKERKPSVKRWQNTGECGKRRKLAPKKGLDNCLLNTSHSGNLYTFKYLFYFILSYEIFKSNVDFIVITL